MRRVVGWLLLGALVVGAGLALRAGGDGASDGAARAEAHGAWLDIPAAEVSFRTLEGGEASLADFRGRVVLVNFWGTWCPPCRREIPELVKLQDAFEGRAVTVVGVAVESGSAEEIRDFAERFGVNYPIWISNAQKALMHYDAVGYPFTLLVDAEGTIRKQYMGPQSFESLARDIEHFVPEAAD